MRFLILFLVIGLVKTQDTDSNSFSDSTDSNSFSDSTDSNDWLDTDSNDFSDSASSTEWSDSANSNDLSGSSDDDSGSSDEGWRNRLATARRLNARGQWINRRGNVVRALNNRQTQNLGQASSRRQAGPTTIIRPGSSLWNNVMRGTGVRLAVRGQVNTRNTNRLPQSNRNRLTQTNANRLTQTNTISPGRTNWGRAGINFATRFPRRNLRGTTLSSWNIPGIIGTTLNRTPNWRSNTRFSSMRLQPSRLNYRRRTTNNARNSLVRRRQPSRMSPSDARSRFVPRRRTTTGGSSLERIVVRQTSPPYRLVYKYVPK